MEWTQFFVEDATDPSNTVRTVTRLEPTMKVFGALPLAPDGKVICEDDGSVEIRLLWGTASILKSFFDANGLSVVREINHEA